VRSAREELAAGRPPRNRRELFRVLRELLIGEHRDESAD
jgi:ribosomal 50S subunit-associated protein YjgA (DUF615 family)